MELAIRVVRRFVAMQRRGFEFNSPQALREYIQEHPQADRSKHTVKPPGADSKGKSEPSKQTKAPVPTQKPEPKSAPTDKKPEPKPTPTEKKPESDSKGEPKSNGSKPRKYKTKPLPKPKEAARVGIPGKAVIPPPDLPRLPNLKEDEKKVESRFNDVVESDTEEVAKQFSDNAEKEGWVFETDAAKTLMPEWTRPDLPPDERDKPIHPERAKFRAKYNAVLHQAANAIAKKAFISRLDDIEKMPLDKRKILVTSGGVAAGKGMGLKARPDLKEGAAAVWDAAGEQNATENEWILEECRKRGIRPVFLFVHKDPKESWVGAVDRAKSIGRMVDARVFADSYAQGAKNFKDFYDKHKDSLGPESFTFANVVKDPDAKDPKKNMKADILESFPEDSLKIDPDELYNYASEYIDENKDNIPSYIYEGATIGRHIWGEK